MRNSDTWTDPQTMLPIHFEIVYVKLYDEPDERYYGCYCGLGMWSCEGLGRTVMTRDIEGWQGLPLRIGPFRDDI